MGAQCTRAGVLSVARIEGRLGKLIAAATAWASGDSAPSFTQEERSLRAFGATDEQINARRSQWQAAQESSADKRFHIYPANCEAFRVFMACETQWEKPGMASSRCTISFPEIESMMRMFGVRDQTDCLTRVVLMVKTARNIFIKRFNEESATGGRRGG